MSTTTFTILGTHCRACKALIEDVCGDLQGVTSSTLDFSTGELVINHDQTVDWPALKKAIESIGNYKLRE